MKLAYLSISKIPSREANSVHVMKMCQAFAHLGHEVTLVAPDVRLGLEPDVADPYRFYGVEPVFAMRKVPWRSFKGRGYAYGWEAGRTARRMGVDAAFGRSLHACVVAAGSGVPTTFDAHMPTFLRQADQRWLFERMIRTAAFRRLAVNCGALGRAALGELPELANRIVVAHNGADPVSNATGPADLGDTRGRPQIGYVGHLYQGKGFEIVRELAARVPSADFHVVGGDHTSVAQLRADATVPGNVRLHGFVPPAQVDSLTLAFDVVLAPYQVEVRTAGGGETAAWTSPLKVFGYMAAGKPILCSDLPVLREVIEHGRNGVLLPPSDAAAWAAALRDLIGNPSERARLGAAARTGFLSRHTWQQRASRVLEGLSAA
ncbi:MAG: glycosyltransferase family 4 protein [Vicinamibacterales bacterium]